MLLLPVLSSQCTINRSCQDALECIVHKREAQEGRRSTPTLVETRDNRAYDIISLLARELPKLVKSGPDGHFGTGPQKRRRVDDEFLPNTVSNGVTEDSFTSPRGLPSSECLDAVLGAYFACIHPWIPMVHQARLRRRLADPAELPKLNVLLQAMILAASRFVDDQDVVHALPGRSRAWVVSTAMDHMSVESLQAIIIVAFNDVSR